MNHFTFRYILILLESWTSVDQVEYFSFYFLNIFGVAKVICAEVADTEKYPDDEWGKQVFPQPIVEGWICE